MVLTLVLALLAGCGGPIEITLGSVESEFSENSGDTPSGSRSEPSGGSSG